MHDSVLEGQPQVVGSAAIYMDNWTDAETPFNALRHLQLLPIYPYVLQYDIRWNISQVDAENLVVIYRLYGNNQNSDKR